MHSPMRRLIEAGVLTAVTDGLFASVSSLLYGSNPTRVFQGVAATILGPQSFQGGARTALIGVAMHVAVAFWWSAVFLFVVSRFPFVRRRLDSRGGQIRVAAVYGPCIWLVMSLVVIPLLLHRSTSITPRWWIQLIGHFPFVGVPIVMAVSRVTGRQPPVLKRKL